MRINHNRHPLTGYLRWRLYWLLLAITLTATTPALAQRQDPASQYDHAISLLRKGATQQDYAEAVKWLRLAAAQGHAHAQYGLALRYLLGQGVQKDPQTATTWLQQAAEQGLAEAQFSLGLRYYWGHGATKNRSQAEYWLAQAARQGHLQARQFLLENHLQPAASAAAPALPSGPAVELNSGNRLIEAYARAVTAAATGGQKTLTSKQQLEEQMTSSEVMLAIQRSAKPSLSAPELTQKLSELSMRLATAEDYFLAANRLFQAGELQQAIALYEKCLKMAPDNANSYKNLATAYAHSGQNRKAIASLRRSIALSPGQAAKHAVLGLIYHVDQNIEAALAEYRAAARLNPAIGWLYPEMADIYLQQKNYPAAAKALAQGELLGQTKERLNHRLSTLAPNVKASQLDLMHATLHLRQLVLSSRQEANQALQELRSKTDFDLLAKQRSVKQYRFNGGYWGPYQPTLLASQFSSPLTNLPPMSFSPIIKTRDGFHILQKFPVYQELLSE